MRNDKPQRDGPEAPGGERSPYNSAFRTPHSALVLGLVGGIGSGKSQVAEAFARHGARVVSGDGLAHEALRQPEIKEQVVRRWGPDILDEKGEVRRRQLGAIVFADPAQRKELEEILHPWIQGRIRAEVEAARRDPEVPLVVLDAAVMLEAGWDGVCDRLVYVDAPREARLRRVAGQRGWSAQEVEAREGAQMPLTDKAARADHVLDNSASLEHLGRQVRELLWQWGLLSVEAAPEAPTPRAGRPAGR
jgi:dephospho-CoA kinase